MNERFEYAETLKQAGSAAGTPFTTNDGLSLEASVLGRASTVLSQLHGLTYKQQLQVLDIAEQTVRKIERE